MEKAEPFLGIVISIFARCILPYCAAGPVLTISYMVLVYLLLMVSGAFTALMH